MHDKGDGQVQSQICPALNKLQNVYISNTITPRHTTPIFTHMKQAFCWINGHARAVLLQRSKVQII